MIDPAGRADAGAFLSRLVRLDPAAVVRLRPHRGRAGLVEIWARLPFGVLVTRLLPAPDDRAAGDGPGPDATVEAGALLGSLLDPAPDSPSGAGDLRRRDEAWLWPLPPGHGVPVEALPAVEVLRVAQAASRTLRTAAERGVDGRVVGERVVRDALLDHVPIVVTADDRRIDVSQRLVQAVVRMGFIRIGSDDPHSVASITTGQETVTVSLDSGWTGLDASYGSAWYRPSSPLRLR